MLPHERRREQHCRLAVSVVSELQGGRGRTLCAFEVVEAPVLASSREVQRRQLRAIFGTQRVLIGPTLPEGDVSVAHGRSRDGELWQSVVRHWPRDGVARAAQP